MASRVYCAEETMPSVGICEKRPQADQRDADLRWPSAASTAWHLWSEYAMPDADGRVEYIPAGGETRLKGVPLSDVGTPVQCRVDDVAGATSFCVQAFLELILQVGPEGENGAVPGQMAWRTHKLGAISDPQAMGHGLKVMTFVGIGI